VGDYSPAAYPGDRLDARTGQEVTELEEALDEVLRGDIDGEKLRQDAERWQAAADEAEAEGDLAADLWRRARQRAERELECYAQGLIDGRNEGYERGRRDVLEHLPKEVLQGYWEAWERAHERGQG
jgi:flagellar biosynthesis/type III secretory pathway protein FliH